MKFCSPKISDGHNHHEENGGRMLFYFKAFNGGADGTQIRKPAQETLPGEGGKGGHS